MSLRAGGHPGARSPCRVAIARVRAVLAPIWRKINEYPSEVALGWGKQEYAAVPLYYSVSQGALVRVLQFIVLQQYFFSMFLRLKSIRRGCSCSCPPVAEPRGVRTGEPVFGAAQTLTLALGTLLLQQ